MDSVKIASWKYPWLRHGFSVRQGGGSTVYGGRSLNLGWTKDDDSAQVAENRRLFWEAISGQRGQQAVTVRQIHSSLCHTIGESSGLLATPEGRAVLEGDGLMTCTPGVLLGIQTADCVPVLVVDPRHRAVAAFHAGWRGTVAGIVEEGIARMQTEFGSRPEDLLAAVGPSIGPCCYTVGGEVLDRFYERYPYAEELFRREEDQTRLDLWKANLRQLQTAGLPSEDITVVGECTGCTRTPSGERRYFSHRMEQGFTGRMMSCIGIFPEESPLY